MKFLKYLPLLTAFWAFTAPGGWAHEEEEGFTQPELDQMLAPIALYPDVLLSQVLMAATYPLEVVEASRWSQANPGLEGDQAVRAVEEMNWDQSVKSLVGFPDLIALMDENLTWTRRLGDAFLIQEEQVMETVQILRSKAMETGNLASLEHVSVEETAEQIIIEPAQIEVVYVPYYSTRVVYGDWWWSDFPPVYWYPRPVYHNRIGFSWSRGFRVSTSFYFSSCDWSRRSIVIHDQHKGRDRYDFRNVRSRRDHLREAPKWRHQPEHRKGVYYRSGDLNDRYDRRRYVDSTRQRARDERRGELRDRPRSADVTGRLPHKDKPLRRSTERTRPQRDEGLRTNKPRAERNQPLPPRIAKAPPKRLPPPVVTTVPPKVTVPAASPPPAITTAPRFQKHTDSPATVRKSRERKVNLSKGDR